MKTIFLISILAFTLFIKNQKEPVKIITPGEHLGFELESFDLNNKGVATTITQGENWTAIYIENGYFKTKPEKLFWDTTQNFTIQSDTLSQPAFYVKGMDKLLKEGNGTEFSWEDISARKPLTWTFNHSDYTILYSDDANVAKIISYKEGLINTDQELIIFKGIKSNQIVNFELEERYIVNLHWTGDLNGDNEPDFLIRKNTHHETISIELILSDKANGKTRWRRIARFTEWS